MIVSALPTPSADILQRQLALQPAFNGATRLLGQVAGLLLLANAGSNLDRQRQHVAAAQLQWRALDDAVRNLEVSQIATSIACSIERLGILLERLERRFRMSLGDDAELRAMLEELAAIRSLLQKASCPQHGLALVDFAGACCAGAH